MFESKVYSIGSERVDEDLSGLLVGTVGEAGVGVWSGVEETIVAVVEALSGREVY